MDYDARKKREYNLKSLIIEAEWLENWAPTVQEVPPVAYGGGDCEIANYNMVVDRGWQSIVDR